jgi:hypothetical protein
LCERHRFCQFGCLLGQLGQVLPMLRRQPLRRPEDQPGGPARGEPAPWRASVTVGNG